MTARARGRSLYDRAPNKTELLYSRSELEPRRLAGEIQRWDFAPIKLRLADRTWYTPDFAVYLADWTLEFHEIKASKKTGQVIVEDDAMVKIKVAAEQHPFRFVMLKKGQFGFEAVWESPR